MQIVLNLGWLLKYYKNLSVNFFSVFLLAAEIITLIEAQLPCSATLKVRVLNIGMCVNITPCLSKYYGCYALHTSIIIHTTCVKLCLFPLRMKIQKCLIFFIIVS